MSPMQRVRITFWLLVATATVSAGALTRAVGWRAGPATGTTVAVIGTVTVVAVAFAARILVVIGRGR